MFKSRTAVLAACAIASLSLAACSNSEQDSTASSESAASTSAAASSEAKADSSDDATIEFEDAYIRAMDKDAEMTAIFGTLKNESDEDITVTGFTSSVKAKQYQTHEVVDGVMQEKKDGFTIPAGGELELAPGGFHFMLMGVDEPIMAGETATVTLELADGSTVELGEIPVRSVGAGDENYGDMEGMDHDQMEHGDMEGMEHGEKDN
ncbi:copper chaperone PCu(A)C [Corynebacterium sp.]|uniref:copper chaperone PCu(A)C n=1 Tax=Corynebacterium sp. TaxID=1720 RepID=UPI0026DD90BB|nr:copper chaperone PCu(A)C [Corynebacterium sp.]MDO5031733.1 copper chaperone PCu(A)C [Corynebacterium sp.]